MRLALRTPSGACHTRRSRLSDRQCADKGIAQDTTDFQAVGLSHGCIFLWHISFHCFTFRLNC